MADTEKRGRGRPATGQTPLRNVRVPDEIWHAAKHIAAARGETLTDVIVAALQRYVARHRATPGSS